MFKLLVVIGTVVHVCSARSMAYYDTGPEPQEIVIPFELLLSNIESPDTLPVQEEQEHSDNDYIDVPPPLEDAHRVMTEVLEEMFSKFGIDGDDGEGQTGEEMLF